MNCRVQIFQHDGEIVFDEKFKFIPLSKKLNCSIGELFVLGFDLPDNTLDFLDAPGEGPCELDGEVCWSPRSII